MPAVANVCVSVAVPDAGTGEFVLRPEAAVPTTFAVPSVVQPVENVTVPVGPIPLLAVAIVAVSVTAVVVVTPEVGLAPTVVVVGAAVMLPALKLLERPNRARNCWTSETFGLESRTMAIVTPVPGEFPGTADNCSGDLLFSSGKNFPKWDEGRVRKDPSLRSASHNIPRMRQLMLKLTVAFAVALPDVPVMPTDVEPVMAMSNVPLCEGLV